MLGGLFDSKVRAALFALTAVGTGAWLYVKVPVLAFWTVSVPDSVTWFSAAMVLAAAVGLYASRMGRKALPWHPRIAMGLFETRALVSLVLLSVITWATLCAAGLLAAGDDADAAVTQSLGELEKAVTAVIAAIGAAIAGEGSRNAVETKAQQSLQDAFRAVQPTAADHSRPKIIWPTEVKRAVFSDPYVPEVRTNPDGKKSQGATGWGLEARWQRAAAIAANLPPRLTSGAVADSEPRT